MTTRRDFVTTFATVGAADAAVLAMGATSLARADAPAALGPATDKALSRRLISGPM